MTRRSHRAYAMTGAHSVDWRRLVLCLLAAVAVILAIAVSKPVNAADIPSTHYFTGAGDLDTDCDQSHGLVGSHCHNTVTCTAHAQLAPGAAGSVTMPTIHPLPAVRQVGDSRTLTPNPQPPKHSNPA